MIKDTYNPFCPTCGYEHNGKDVVEHSFWPTGHTYCDDCGAFFYWSVEEDAEYINERWKDNSTYTTWNDDD